MNCRINAKYASINAKYASINVNYVTYMVNTNIFGTYEKYGLRHKIKQVDYSKSYFITVQGRIMALPGHSFIISFITTE